MAITDGLVRVYHFNGNFKDSWGGKDFTSYGAVINSTAQKLGSGAVEFDGVDDYLQASDAGLVFGSGARTINAWVYRHGSGHFTVFTYGSLDVYGNQCDFDVNWGGNAGWLAIAWHGHGWGVGSNVVPLNTWTMITMRIPSGATTTDQGELFLNAVKQTSTTLGGSVQTLNTIQSGNCYIGRTIAATSYGDGLVDEVAFWNRALTDAEISYLYNGGAGREIGFRPWLIGMDE